ncbi:polysaccharide deacetylase family protein [Streptomyces sp. NPDC020799]|uniref:polysaccharide deacetylase family protein n=1 Tax=Streptomyces sp. NPDC020799 TaxID=3365091 RepID=UPI0037AEC771
MAKMAISRQLHLTVTIVVLTLTVLATGCTAETAETPDRKEQSATLHPEKYKDAGAPNATELRTSPNISHESESDTPSADITIDDGPDPNWTIPILDTLKKNKVKATFCMVGVQVLAYPDLVKKVAAAGHRLCDHSVDHDVSMDKRSEIFQREQILKAKQIIEDAAGDNSRVYYYRAPGGAFTPYSRNLAASYGMRPLGWNVDTEDWKRPGVDTIVANVRKEIHSGPVILFHDGGGNRSQTVTALQHILPWLKSSGFKLSFPKS